MKKQVYMEKLFPCFCPGDSPGTDKKIKPG
jgi:hypothetical protein